MKANNSTKKQQLIDEKLATPLEVGERIYVLGKHVNAIRPENRYAYIISKIVDEDTVLGKKEDGGSYNKEEKEIKVADIIERWTYDIGENPFNESIRNVRFVAYTLQSILYKLGLNDGDEEKEKLFERLEDKPLI